MQPARCTLRPLVGNDAIARIRHSWCAPGTRSQSSSQRVVRASSPTYYWPHHRLVGTRVGRSSCTGLDMITQRDYSRRSVVRIAADPCGLLIHFGLTDEGA